MFSCARDVLNALETCLQNELGSEYNKLKYLDDLNQNGTDLRRGFGVRPGITIEQGDLGTTKHLTYAQTFEFVLAKAYKTSAPSDSRKYTEFLNLHELALCFVDKVYETKAGLPGKVLNVTNIVISEPQFLEDKITVLTGTIDITYRLTI